MICSWLSQNNNASNVIVFFNGWGLEQSVVQHLSINSDTNVLVVSDYSDLNFELPDVSSYQQRYLVAWSFGVANYQVWQGDHADIFDHKIAINGTPQGIDRTMGIAERIVQHTIDTLSADSFKEFVSRCYNGEVPSTVNNALSESDVLKKKNELQLIKDRHYSPNSNTNWNSVLIGQHDKIFPNKNQNKAWHGSAITPIDAAHAPFALWSNWHDLLTA